MTKINVNPELDQENHRVTVMGVEYVHFVLANGDDLYLTQYGLPFAPQLAPECYYLDRAWFQANHNRLNGTSSVYRVWTKPVDGHSLDIVLKWNRMGQDVPGATGADDLALAEFNSPFEEFALTLELRQSRPVRIRTHKPLAIYVPAQSVEWDRTGRKRYKFEAKQKVHTDVPLYTDRSYAVLYEWIKGIDAAQAYREGRISKEEMASLTLAVSDKMQSNGFVVHDNKPHHIIVRPDHGELKTNREEQPLWAYIDFELLQRSPEYEREVRQAKRKIYLVKQAERFKTEAVFPSHLQPVRNFDVDYVYGQIESTGGALWVVGKDPDLFDYFLPEKWRKMPRTKLSASQQVYETTTKDNVRLVWRVSRVGHRPDMDPFRADEKCILNYGYNSPFEEIALAMKLSASGVASIYPRAIYMTGSGADVSSRVSDTQRYTTHADLRTPEGKPVLQEGHEYIIIWGYWNGPDELLAVKDDPPYTNLSALDAYRNGFVDEPTYLRLMEDARRRLADVGVEDLNLRGSHLLLSLNTSGELEMNSRGLPMILICNFELLHSHTPLRPREKS